MYIFIIIKIALITFSYVLYDTVMIMDSVHFIGAAKRDI
jgi:hypothetical protein